MSGNEDLSALLKGLLSGNGENGEEGGGTENGGEDSLFGDIDPDTLLKIFDIASKVGGNDKNTALLMALRPHLREENRAKLDRAAKLMKLMSIIPLLRDSGIADELFNHTKS